MGCVVGSNYNTEYLQKEKRPNENVKNVRKGNLGNP
jgi:hypothetical protein